MIRKYVGSLVMLGAVALAGCSKDTDGELLSAPPLAGLRYVNVVPDTGAMDIRIVDVVQLAPNTVASTFRGAGAPYGLTIAGIPNHTAVLAGTRRIRAFMNSINPAIATTQMLDTTFTFDAGVNYTFYLYGYAQPAGPGRPASAPSLRAIITRDDPAPPAGNIAIRTIHMAPELAPTLASGSVDVYVDALLIGDTPTGAPTWAAVAPLTDNSGVSAYVNRPTGSNYRVAVAAAATTTPIIAADIPAGTAGTGTTNPIPGEAVAGSAFSVVIVPRSVAGSPAASFTTPSVLVVVDRLPPRTAP